ncbi:CLIP domain-containing serine protease B4-like isoform X2 [Epargyreus clarus]|uniref:CLIP domain-containing serine protease B4-like isoform X2 n=1 Tax=Epargyreus clarus TaxID=520877 RepID=UPI003C2B6BFB
MAICKNVSRRIVILIVVTVVVVVILGAIATTAYFTIFDDTRGQPDKSGPWKKNTKCKTQDGRLGVCRKRPNCYSSHKILTEETQCGPCMFCCADESYTKPNENCTSPTDPRCTSNQDSRPNIEMPHFVEGPCRMSSEPPDPASRCCGLQSSTGHSRIIGGSASPIDEYPWTAALEYERNGVSRVRCGGSLISGRYVLTAAHCVMSKNGTWTLKNVRLGDYNISNPGRDCVHTKFGEHDDCTDGEVIVPVQDIISHPDYNVTHRYRSSHDIALIRLDRIVNYTDFIRPICLPSVDFTKTLPVNDTFYVAGWGSNSINSSTEVKFYTDLQYVPQQECKEVYANIKIEIKDGRFCAGGVNRKDVCAGDSGGPLMKKSIYGFMELVGIVSYGPSRCGEEGVPGVYTKVHAYLTWIRDHILVVT